MQAPFAILGCAVAMLAASAAQAGRPLATDDAGTTSQQQCLVESWLERTSEQRLWVLAPACGVAEGLELGADYSLPNPRDSAPTGGGLAVKWAPAAWTWETPGGTWALGLKAALAFERSGAPARWRSSEDSVLGLASWSPAPAWNVHANFGTARNRDSGSRANLLNLAGTWSPSERVMLFAEWQGNDRRDVFGGNLRTSGVRWWLLQDRVGLDLTVSRETGSGSANVWSLGFGWYDIRF